jgi:hypothetical protein
MVNARSLSVLGVACSLFAPPAPAEIIYGITISADGPQTLVRFDSAAPGVVTTVGPFTGLHPGQTVTAMDFRPATGALYVGVATTDPTHSGAQLLTVNLATAALTAVGPAFDPTGYGYPSFDFDPVRDQLRVATTPANVTNTRFNPDTGALIANDAGLAFPPLDPSSAEPPYIVGAAYTNNLTGATSTTLYGYDLTTDNLVRIGGPDGDPTPNDGTAVTVGNSGFVVAGTVEVGFDISGATGIAYLSGPVEGLPGVHLFMVNLDTGRMTDLGQIGIDGSAAVTDISVAVPEPSLPGLAAAATAAWLFRRRQVR